MRKISTSLMIVILAFVLASCGCKHEWQDATCEKPRFCAICGETKGEPLGHHWKDATCREPKHCTICGETVGGHLNHVWRVATCEKPRHCVYCGETVGDCLNHVWKDVSAEKSRYCVYCGKTLVDCLEHDWEDATCESPRVCRVCYATTGKPLKHEWNRATCTAPKTCRFCGVTEGEALGHTAGEITEKPSVPKGAVIVEQKCKVCNTRLQYKEVPMTSFVEDDRFLFSPGSFMNRIQTRAKKLGNTFEYAFTDRDGVLQADFTWKAKGEERQGYLLFFKENNVLVQESERWDNGVWCVNMVADGPRNRLADNINEDLLRLLYMSCDPALSVTDSSSFMIKKMETAIRTAKQGDLAGYYERNGLLYEFMHVLVEDASADSVLVYPKDWRK